MSCADALGGQRISELKRLDAYLHIIAKCGRDALLNLRDALMTKVHVQVPYWLGEIVKYHIERLRLLNLDGAPLGKSMGVVTVIFAESITASASGWDESLDAWRLRQAFIQLEKHCDRWPSPRMVIDRMPPRIYPRALPKPRTEAMRQAGLQALRELRDKLRGGA